MRPLFPRLVDDFRAMLRRENVIARQAKQNDAAEEAKQSDAAQEALTAEKGEGSGGKEAAEAVEAEAAEQEAEQAAEQEAEKTVAPEKREEAPRGDTVKGGGRALELL
jgi:hypothetical protein